MKKNFTFEEVRELVKVAADYAFITGMLYESHEAPFEAWDECFCDAFVADLLTPIYDGCSVEELDLDPGEYMPEEDDEMDSFIEFLQSKADELGDKKGAVLCGFCEDDHENVTKICLIKNGTGYMDLQIVEEIEAAEKCGEVDAVFCDGLLVPRDTLKEGRLVLAGEEPTDEQGGITINSHPSKIFRRLDREVSLLDEDSFVVGLDDNTLFCIFRDEVEATKELIEKAEADHIALCDHFAGEDALFIKERKEKVDYIYYDGVITKREEYFK